MSNRWILIKDKLPEENQKVWVTKEYHGGVRRIEPSIFRKNEFYVTGYREVTCTNLVKAWCSREIPEPYMEVSEK